MFDKHFIVIYKANGKLDAEMIKAFLESVDIQVLLNQESAGSSFGLTIGPLGLVDILVPVDKEVEARKLLDEMDRGDFELSNDDEIDENSNIE